MSDQVITFIVQCCLGGLLAYCITSMVLSRYRTKKIVQAWSHLDIAINLLEDLNIRYSIHNKYEPFIVLRPLILGPDSVYFSTMVFYWSTEAYNKEESMKLCSSDEKEENKWKNK